MSQITSSPVLDRFESQQTWGTVVGTNTSTGERRLGVDSGRLFAVDNGALRIRTPLRPGWGQAVIAFGPYSRKCGLTFAVHILNGHNTSQSGALGETIWKRLHRWARGSEADTCRNRLKGFISGRHIGLFWRRLRQWISANRSDTAQAPTNENLAIGWYPTLAPKDPTTTGTGFVMHATGSECGELWARVGRQCAHLIRGVQNIPLFLVVVMRERGAAYYASSLSGVPGFSSIPRMRLLAIDSSDSEQTLYASIQQSVLGQIGFRVETRVRSVQVADVQQFANWFGAAHAADRLCGHGLLHETPAEIGGVWECGSFGIERTSEGIILCEASMEEMHVAILHPTNPTGFIALDVAVDRGSTDCVGIVWRAQNSRNFWSFESGTTGSRLAITRNGKTTRFPEVRNISFVGGRRNSLQIVDDGYAIRIFVNGELFSGSPIFSNADSESRGVGVIMRGRCSSVKLQNFEAHPIDVEIPDLFCDKSLVPADGSKIEIEDDYAGAQSSLSDRQTPNGLFWEKTLGSGEFTICGDGNLKVNATSTRPCPGRTMYTLEWKHADFADLEVAMTPPGPSADERDRGRGGVVFWQDGRNHIIVNLWMDSSYGFSISSFHCLDGFEEIYDAVWTNIGRRVACGVPFRLRVSFDGMHFLARVNDEPVLYRALTDIYPDQQPLKINRVGIVANWEWGNDTGTVFHKFKARCRA